MADLTHSFSDRWRSIRDGGRRWTIFRSYHAYCSTVHTHTHTHQSHSRNFMPYNRVLLSQYYYLVEGKQIGSVQDSCVRQCVDIGSSLLYNTRVGKLYIRFFAGVARFRIHWSNGCFISLYPRLVDIIVIVVNIIICVCIHI